MKELKKLILAVLCVGVIFGTTACGTRNNANDNAANDTTTEQNGTNNTTNDDNVNDNNGGVINDIGNTAGAYADGHLGCVELLDGSQTPSFDADFHFPKRA